MYKSTIVTDAALEGALNELARLDEKEAQLKAARDYGETKQKEIFYRLYNQAEGTIEDKKAYAYTDPEYLKHALELRKVVEKHQCARNRRETLAMMKDVWQSENANIRSRS